MHKQRTFRSLRLIWLIVIGLWGITACVPTEPIEREEGEVSHPGQVYQVWDPGVLYDTSSECQIKPDRGDNEKDDLVYTLAC